MEGVFEKEEEGSRSLGANHLMGRRHTERHKELRYRVGAARRHWEHQESIEERKRRRQAGRCKKLFPRRGSGAIPVVEPG